MRMYHAQHEKLIEKAPKGRNLIACGNATGVDARLFLKALKGRNIYVALTGLAVKIMDCVLWRCHRLLYFAPSGLSWTFQAASS
jgi:hypothetical protein